jgi:hypothetical protein
MVGQTLLQTRVIVPTPLLLVPGPWAVAFLRSDCSDYSARQQIVGSQNSRNFSGEGSISHERPSGSFLHLLSCSS